MIWNALKEITGQEFSLLQLASLDKFAESIKKQRAHNPAGENDLYAKWQQAQYMYSMFTTNHAHLANKRYEGLTWTSSLDYLKCPLSCR